jgi:YebC/PmpR family DNA-binding regulatory protein
MAGHSKFKNIMHRKGAQDKKRAKIFTKIGRVITVAVKLMGPDSESNPRLRLALLEAREVNMPKDIIDRAIKRATGNIDNANYEEIRYEGYAPFGVAVIVEALTDNRNRTAPEVRHAFTKYSGSLGETGSVGFLFDRVGLIVYENTSNSEFENIFEKAIELNAIDVEFEDGDSMIYTNINDLHSITNDLKNVLQKECNSSSLIFKAKKDLMITINDVEQATSILKLIDLLEDNDDVQKVYTNLDVLENVLEKIEM